MKLSIIIPTYNRIKLLKNILSDLIAQSEKNFEILIIDDHSQDTTEQEVQQLAKKYPYIRYKKNQTSGQRDAKILGLTYASGAYIVFLEDDIRIPDTNYIQKLYHVCNDTQSVIVSKVIMCDKGEKNIQKDPKKYSTYPPCLLETAHGKNNEGVHIRDIFPFMETGVIFHTTLSSYFIDQNLILDGYGESYASGIKLLNKGIRLRLHPALEIYHKGSPTGGSKRFQKQGMRNGFTEFHYGYFYNMIYLHARYKPWHIGVWLPFYIGKSIIALITNKNGRGFFTYALVPISKSFYTHFIRRDFI